MAHKRKKLVSSLAVFMIIICVLCIAAGLTSNLMFGGRNASPTVAGYQIYLNRTADMQPLVTQNAAVFVQAQHDYAKENVVLYTNSAGDKTIGRISLISADTEGSDAKIIYYLNNASGTETAEIEKNSIIGLCRFENIAIGSALLVMTGTWGIILLIALPCVILLIYVISRFIAANAEDEEEEEEHDRTVKTRKKPQSPLFNADSAKHADEDFAERKASLAEHFHQKGADASKKKKHKSESRQKPADAEASRQRRAKIEEAERLLAREDSRKKGEQDYAQENETDGDGNDMDARVAAIKRAMRQRAEERERIQAEEEQRIAASKAKQHAAQQQSKQEAPKAAEKSPVKTAAPTASRTANRRPARSSAPMDLEELMRQLDEEKKKLS